MRVPICIIFALASCLCQATVPTGEDGFLGPLPVGFSELRAISPDILELMLVTTKKPEPARVEQWDFVDERGEAHLPSNQQFTVIADGKNFEVKRVGFKRR